MSDMSEQEAKCVLKCLKFARSRVKDIHVVDTEIIYAMCTCGRLTGLEEFISQPHGGDLEETEARCKKDLLQGV